MAGRSEARRAEGEEVDRARETLQEGLRLQRRPLRSTESPGEGGSVRERGRTTSRRGVEERRSAERQRKVERDQRKMETSELRRTLRAVERETAKEESNELMDLAMREAGTGEESSEGAMEREEERETESSKREEDTEEESSERSFSLKSPGGADVVLAFWVRSFAAMPPFAIVFA
ncbi:hypothetical protein AAFF_G00298970 [Aldrovandia affinis]|uniref:Uncharacterized protein n=1 Tax=Aldrovandia affinis TaxID=143900 RepID=A0AAD7R8W7_9TELE|nr:hypothetical protein AAFF_G00298970 [Aldrovandia affinis]